MKTNPFNVPNVQELHSEELLLIDGGKGFWKALSEALSYPVTTFFQEAAEVCRRLGPSAEQAALQFN